MEKVPLEVNNLLNDNTIVTVPSPPDQPGVQEDWPGAVVRCRLSQEDSLPGCSLQPPTSRCECQSMSSYSLLVNIIVFPVFISLHTWFIYFAKP